jgi:hypothetical protein
MDFRLRGSDVCGDVALTPLNSASTLFGYPDGGSGIK